MTPHQMLALGVRLFVVWFGLITVRQLLVYLGNWRSPSTLEMLGFAVASTIITFVVLLTLWRSPKAIANGLLRDLTDAPTQSPSYQAWFALGTALLGLWFIASAIAPILHNLAIMHIFQSELTNPEHLRGLRSGIFRYAIELVIGTCLLFGANGISRFIWWARRAGS